MSTPQSESSTRSRSPRLRRATAALAVTAALALTAAACTGSSSGSAGSVGSSSAPVTITFWHGWSQPNELKAINDNIANFEKLHPNIKVKAVSNVTDDKINQALRAGGSQAPDVVSSFTTDNVGQFCGTHEFADLTPFLQKDGIDPAKTFPKQMVAYTQYNGDQCSLPLLGDAFGLYYNVDMFKAAGITSPPKTLSEFDADAVKLTRSSGDSYSQLGFMPDYHGFESTPAHYLGSWGPKYLTAGGTSNLAADPAFAAQLTWQKNLIDKLGGFSKLEKYRNTFTDEFASNPFDKGKTAMSIDGEWRVANLTQEHPSFTWATAPFPVPDDQVAQYGKGYQTGTIIGMASTSKNQAAAWEFLKYLTTDTNAVVTFANAIYNVPSTLAALQSPQLNHTPQFQTFLDIANNPNTSTTPASPNGGAYQVSLQNFAYKYESGQGGDLKAGLAATDTQIDHDLAQTK
ncbi:ABC transporter substrate-binding protein [Streptacidiphilus sp. EB129]|uniref:ABC transporter substrate-binding protein n=1 Tax=Streptacidiphilus sp. EB129 TaxID=3156262 RepID=UPI0035194040